MTLMNVASEEQLEQFFGSVAMQEARSSSEKTALEMASRSLDRLNDFSASPTDLLGEMENQVCSLQPRQGIHLHPFPEHLF
jgi:hypothetical protein